MTQERDSFVRSTLVISALTLVSRLLGVLRDAACAAFFGGGMLWDAFSFAFRIPNLFRRLFGEGALTAAFLPVLSEYVELRPQEDAFRLAGRTAGALTAVLVVLIGLGEAVVLALLLWADVSAGWHLALSLTALLLPYVLLICLTALAGAILHTLKRFVAPALAPIVLNVCWIGAVVGLAPALTSDARTQVHIVAAAILASGVLQLWVQMAALRRRGFRWRPLFELAHPEVRRVAAAMAPVALGLAAFQLNALLDGVMAISLARPEGADAFGVLGFSVRYPLEIGANSALYYANRLMQLPLGVFGIALATAAFPTLSGQAAREDWERFARSLLRGLGLMIFIGVPAGVGLIILRVPAVQLLFERGAFSPAMTARTARVLLFYSTGIWAYCALHVLTRAFYSVKEQATPARVAGAMVGLNLALNLALVWPLREAGLAAATAVCAMLQVVILTFLLGRRVRLAGLGGLAVTAVKTSVATGLMSAAAWPFIRGADAGGGLGLRLVRVLLPAAAGGATFFAAAALLRTEELWLLLRALRHRRTATQ